MKYGILTIFGRHSNRKKENSKNEIKNKKIESGKQHEIEAENKN